MPTANRKLGRPAVTVVDIAKAAGVSQPTVSQVLNGKGRISDQTRERVLKAARTLGYRPNSYARAMLSRRTGNLGLLLSATDVRSRLLPGLMDGLQDAVIESRLHLVVGRVSDELLTSPQHVPRLLSELSADGLLINYFQDIPAELRRLVLDCEIPVVWLNSCVERPAVFPDDEGGARAATESFLTKGHQRIAYVAAYRSPSDEKVHYSIVERRRGYIVAMEAAGLPPRVVELPSDYTVHSSQRDIRVAHVRAALFEGDEPPTAVVTYEASQAVVVAMAAQQAGLTVGKDIAIATFHPEATTVLPFPVQVWLVPLREVGRRSVHLLLRLIAGDRLPRREAEQRVPYAEPVGDV